jgi:putative ABC transport system substrate-binding protein
VLRPCRNTLFTAALLVVAAVVLSLAGVQAQERQYRVAILTPGATLAPVLTALKEGLAQQGLQEGHNITFIVEETLGDVSQLPERAARLLALHPDLIFTVGTEPTAVAKRATTVLPIVFTYVSDPVKGGFVASYASSGNNMVGISNAAVPLAGKRLEVLHQIAPQVKKVLAIVAANESIALASYLALQEPAHKLGIDLIRHDVTTPEGIQEVLQNAPQGSVDAIYLIPSSLGVAQIDLLIAKARQDRLPLVVHDTDMVKKGALVSYGSDARGQGLQSPKLVAKVLRGAKPSELPIQMPEELRLVLNLRTAREIGLTIPLAVMERVDDLVE